uniref:Uncharacterized protein n=1 Tax=Plectus sambesii TaxID=2011161 RepID=A0A914W5F1_9BILA
MFLDEEDNMYCKWSASATAKLLSLGNFLRRLTVVDHVEEVGQTATCGQIMQHTAGNYYGAYLGGVGQTNFAVEHVKTALEAAKSLLSKNTLFGMPFVETSFGAIPCPVLRREQVVLASIACIAQQYAHLPPPLKGGTK